MILKSIAALLTVCLIITCSYLTYRYAKSMLPQARSKQAMVKSKPTPTAFLFQPAHPSDRRPTGGPTTNGTTLIADTLGKQANDDHLRETPTPEPTPNDIHSDEPTGPQSTPAGEEKNESRSSEKRQKKNKDVVLSIPAVPNVTFSTQQGKPLIAFAP